jgi:acyl-CoA thioester hydrolase
MLRAAAEGGPPMTASEPLTVLRQTVPPGYTDYNQHMADGYYLVVFSDATTGLMDHIGLGPAAREATGHTLFTLEVHANYLKEVKRGAEVRVDCQILGYDQKRLHLFHTMHLGDAPDAVATTEQMQANYDMKAGRTAPFLPEVLAKIEAIQRRQAEMPRPAYVGRVIGLPPKKG